ncbi:MAG: adenosylcobinamide-GDP ribazoletransferase [Treponemataceae bacterium]
MIKGLILALQFFTRLPIKINVDFSQNNLKRMFFFLPFVGLIFGACVAVIMQLKFESEITGVLAVLAYVLLGGSLHIDGLSDWVDGFAANAEKEKTLLIMSDPHIGTFGTIAIILDLLLRFVMYQAFCFNPLLLILPSVLARTFVLYTISYGKPAKEKGLGQLFYNSISHFTFPIFFVLCVLGFGLLCFFGFVPLAFLSLPIINFIVIIILLYHIQKKIGGTTGDTNGACVEILELINLLLCWFLYWV